MSHAEARHRAYGLLGHLWARGMQPALVPIVQALPALAATLEGDAQGWAVAHQDLFGRQVPAYESVFRDPEALLGGEHAALVRAAYGTAGVGLPGGLEPDHLAAELGFLAHLCAAERDATRDGLPAVAQRMRSQQARFLSEHLLAWLPAVLVAIEQEGTALDRAVAALVAELVADHAAEVAAEAPSGWPPIDPALDEQGTRLRHIASWLVRPAASGWLLTQAAMSRIALEADVPEGFGSRERKLEGMFFAAVDHGRIDALAAALLTHAAAWGRAYERLGAQGLPIAAWRRALQRCEGVLARVAEAAPPAA